MADPKILRQSLRIVSGTQKLISLPQAIPLLLGKGHIAALNYVIVHHDDVERSRIGGSIRVGVIGEPRNEVRSLRNFVGNLAVGALIFAQEIQRGACIAEIAFGIERQRSPKRVTAEKPGKTGTLAAARSAVSGNESGTKKWILHQSLEYADPGPVVRLLQLTIGHIHADGAVRIGSVAIRRFFFQSHMIQNEITV